MLSGLNIIEIAILLVSIIVSMVVHEAMHGFVAYWLGDDTAEHAGRLTLNPLKHIDVITTVLLPIILILIGLPPFFAAKPVPFNPYRVKWGEYGAALVGIAGPVTNFVLAAIAAIVGRLFIAHLNNTIDTVFVIFIEVNLAFFVFNMVPFPPLDGSRLLYAFAPDWLRSIMQRIEVMGFLPILVFVLLVFPLIANRYEYVIIHLYNFLVG